MTRTPVDLDLSSLRGRRAVVTGGSDGIGLRIATRLARAGAELVLPVRNPAKGDAALARIRSDAPEARIDLRALDLSSLDSVAALAETLRAEGSPIHLLVNNAGMMTPPQRQSTVDGFEAQFATNHLGHVALVAGLFPLLRAGEARVVTQLSVAANQNAIHWDDLQWERSYDGMRAYSQSKIALGLFALELGRRSSAEGWGVTSMVSHPGVAPTSLLAARPELGRGRDTLSVRMIRRLSRLGILVGTPETAALPALLAATAPGSGRFFGPSGAGHLGGPPAEQPHYSRLQNPAEARRVWDTSLDLIGPAAATALR